jgi:hypothetical protein
MFSPSQADVRRFFCSVYEKSHTGHNLEAIEIIANEWIKEHPEYHADLSQPALALEKMYDADAGKSNPFLHLSMHLTISEQQSIDQPHGVRQAVDLLAAKRNSLHEAHHVAMDCLGEMIWESQRSGLPPDGHAYLDKVRKKATQ